MTVRPPATEAHYYNPASTDLFKAVIEFARNVLGLQDAHSTEMNPHTSQPVIDLMEQQKEVKAKFRRSMAAADSAMS